MSIRRGEVIRINLNPTEGREQAGNARPCLVVSNTLYNAKRKGIVAVMPITSTIRPDIKMMIPVPIAK
ncbi:MAG: type II toxin-antitoxin system PemK/MazF family toxin [Phormidesmis sp.]